MANKRKALAGRAWNSLRLALFRDGKGGIFKRSLIAGLPRNYLKSLRATAHRSIPYNGEREFSFNETPIFNFKTPRSASTRFPHLPPIPCINPSFDFEDYHHDNGDFNFNSGRDDDDEGGEDGLYELNDGATEEEGIDAKAEKFIARFYEQMKLERQESYLEYNEMLQRSTS